MSRLHKAALVFVLAAAFALMPGSLGSEPAVAFEWFDECPANPCVVSPLPTAGVCNDGQQTLLVRRDNWTNTLCYESINP